MDSVINTVAHSIDSITYRGASDGVSDVNKQISELKQTINNQNIIINNVVNRLNFLLSMFSIDEVTMPVLSAAECSSVEVNINSTKVQVDQWPVLSTNQLPMSVDGNVSEVSYINHTDNTDQSGHSVGNKTTKQLYSSALGQNNQNNQNIVQQQPLKQLSQFRQSMVAAV